MKPRIVAIAQTLIVVMAGCYAAVLAKLALHEVPPFTFVWLQIAIGGSLLTFYTFVWRGERIPKDLTWRVWAAIVIIGICNFTIVRVLFILSLERLPATTQAYLINFVGIVTMAMSIFILKERPSLLQILGALVALAGLRVFFKELPPPDELLGVIFIAIGVLALALTNNVTRKLRIATGNGPSNNIISTVALWIGGLPVVLTGILADWPPPVQGLRNWGIISLNAIVSIAIGMTVFNHILRTLRSYEASILAASGVIFVAIFAIPVLGEYLVLHQIGGIAMMLVGICLAQLRRGSFVAPPTTRTIA